VKQYVVGGIVGSVACSVFRPSRLLIALKKNFQELDLMRQNPIFNTAAATHIVSQQFVK
jgi:hypothetical protein